MITRTELWQAYGKALARVYSWASNPDFLAAYISRANATIDSDSAAWLCNGAELEKVWAELTGNPPVTLEKIKGLEK